MLVPAEAHSAKFNWPTVEFHQLAAEVGPPPDRHFEIAFVPPLPKGWLCSLAMGEQGSIQLTRHREKELDLSPGETLNLDIEPPSEAEAARLRGGFSDFLNMQRRVGGAGAEDDRISRTNELAGRAAEADGKPSGPTFRALVLDSETNEAVAGIRLTKSQQPGQPQIEGVSDDSGLLMIENMTPGEVEFDISAVGENQHELAGQYARWWSPDALHDHERQLENDNSGIQRNFDSLMFNVLGNTVPTRIFVEKAVSIRGRVVDPDGKPVAGATVAPALTGSGNSITGDTRYSVRTAADGTFHIRLPASKSSEYNLVAHDGGYQEWRSFANGVGEVVATWPGQELTFIELQLTRPGIVRGKVINADGRPVANHRVRTHAADKLENRYYDPETRTDENGEFELNFVRPGDHFVQADPFWLRDERHDGEASKRITVKAGETVDGIELIHRPANPRPPFDHILPGVPIPSSRLRR
jgi:protocatechuate 3,4-dioxygenase beta subunit